MENTSAESFSSATAIKKKVSHPPETSPKRPRQCTCCFSQRSKHIGEEDAEKKRGNLIKTEKRVGKID